MGEARDSNASPGSCSQAERRRVLHPAGKSKKPMKIMGFSRPVGLESGWWAMLDLNQRPLPCEGVRVTGKKMQYLAVSGVYSLP